MGPLTFEQRVRVGNCYTVTSPNLTAGLLTNIRATIQNPSGSARNFYIYCFESFIGSSGMFFADIVQNPSIGTPTTVITAVNQNLASANTASAVIKCDASNTALAPGTGTKLYTMGLPGNARTPFKEQLLVIPPNMTLGINIPILLVANVGFKIDFWEEL